MNEKIRDSFLNIGWRFPGAKLLSSRRPAILMYHGIPSRCNGAEIDAPVFEKHIAFLKDHFEFVSPRELDHRRPQVDRIQVALTFDDGFRNHAEVAAPILRRHRVPALFFVSSRHSKFGRYLWFSYLKALEKHFRDKGFNFRGQFIDMSPERRKKNIARLRDTLLSLKPHPTAMYEVIDNSLPRLEDFISKTDLSDYTGMTAEQVAELATDPLFSVGIHTVDHPFLTWCTSAESEHQIIGNKRWLEQISGRPCDVLAYPGGAYNSNLLNQCRSIGLLAGYAITPVLNIDTQYEVPRLGIYSPSEAILGFKVQWGNFVEPIRYKVTGKV